MLGSEALETPILSMDRIKRSKGEEEKSYKQSLTPVKPEPKRID